MTRDVQHEIEQLLDEVLQQPSHEQFALLDAATVSCESVREEVRSLLMASHHAGSFLEEPPLAALDAIREIADDADSCIGQAIGTYVIDDRIATGGMGAVYRAHRADAAFEKQVAIKIIKRGMDTEELLQRFRYERNILASLDHPNIARLLDAGETDDGRPYFVMEFVDGTTITEFARSESLSISDRLTLFLKVCDAVQHAHAHLAVHRDLKPANILINADREPKLLDFGIAKIVQPDTRDVDVTHDRAAPMTLRHAAPEQIRGDQVQMATDVYALGMVLYELLTDGSPYNLTDPTPSTYRHAILESDPRPLNAHPPPDSIGSATKWQREVSGDLDTIVLKSLRKDPLRRYRTVQQLADDLVRYREGHPVLAQPDTVTYRVTKFVRRHTVPVAAISALFLTLLAGVVTISALFFHARTQERVAIRSRDEAEAVISFLTDLVGQADPYQDSPDTPIRELLDASARTIDTRFASQPLVRARVQNTLGATYISLGLYDKGANHLGRAYDTLVTHRDGPADQIIDVTSQLARARWRQGRLEDAESLMVDALDLARATYGANHAETFVVMNELGVVKRNRGEVLEAVSLHEEAMTGLMRTSRADPARTLVAMNDLALAYQNLGRYDDAEVLLVETLDTRRKTLGPSAPPTLTSMFNLASLRTVQGRLPEARRMLEDVVSLRSSVLGVEHPIVLTDRARLAGVLSTLGETDEAEAILVETLEVQRRTLGPQHPDVLGTCNDLASIYRKTGRPDRAADMLEEAFEIHASLRGPDHRNTLVLQANLASAYMELDRFEEAASLLLDAIDRSRATLPQPHRFTGVFLARYGRCLRNLDRPDEAVAALRESYDNLAEVLGPAHTSTQDAVRQLCDLHEAGGASDEAATWRARLISDGG